MRVAFGVGLSFIVCVLVTGCKKVPAWKSQTFTETSVKPQAGDSQIPASLWEKVIALNTAAIAAKKAPVKSEQTESKPEEMPETSLEPLKVYLIERNKGVLKGQNRALSYVGGGGELDLSNFVMPLRGSYYIAFEFMPDVEGVDTKVFFLSNSVLI
jgi:hypothetical protein